MSLKESRPLPLSAVDVNDDFFTPFQTRVREVVLPYQEQILHDAVPGAEKSHSIENYRIAAGESSGEYYGRVFQDTDVSKWLEAAAYSLAKHPDPQLEARCDEMIELVGRVQEPDGYLNTYFTIVHPEYRFQNLEEGHELYCAGHLTEAAVAYYQATGKTRLLEIAQKLCDLLCSRFGPGKEIGYPGHPEIELALVRLYEVTGAQRYLDLAQYFILERGKDPQFFRKERAKHPGWRIWPNNPDVTTIYQNQAPVYDQKTVEGHSVRAMYLCTGAADVAAWTEDERLFNACRTLWDNTVQHRMYVTGGVGQTVHGEAFTIDDDLPNDANYAETCASVALCFFANRMLQMEPNARYADELERAVYNGTISGMQLDGKHYFYCNPLEVVPGVSGKLFGYQHMLYRRPQWYASACCPPNLARLLLSISNYAWTENETTLYNHLYVGGTVSTKAGGGMTVSLESHYPWSGHLTYRVDPHHEFCSATLALRVPGWCKAYTLSVNGTSVPVQTLIKDGYLYLARSWKPGDVVTLDLTLEARRVWANTAVRADAGCVALLYGPLVYAAEEADNGTQLSALSVLRDAKPTILPFDETLLSGVCPMEVAGVRRVGEPSLYSTEPPQEVPVTIRLIPYYTWGNRTPGEMRVWLHEKT